MESALATRGYTSKQVRPLLETQMKYQFLPQSVPAFAANEQFSDLRKKFADYDYKEATLIRPIPQPCHRLGNDVVNQFRQAPDRAEIIGEPIRRPAEPCTWHASTDQGRGLPVLPQHRGRGSEDHDRTLRSGEWLRLEAERGGRCTDRVRPHDLAIKRANDTFKFS